MKAWLVLACIAILVACGPNASPPSPGDGASAIDPSDPYFSPPAWAADAIWYQVFVERFRNGDPGNDPTLADVQPGFADTFPDTWAVTDWGHDWYAPEPWVADFGDPSFYRAVQLRRYGGDLQGVLDKLGYLDSLGVNAIYFNPLNESPSLHKYDARNYRHVDRTFGPDPRRDERLVAAEDPLDPSTWVFTSADTLFLAVVDAAHARGIRVIFDYSWNHTGADFWALHRVRDEGAGSPLADWYHVTAYDDPATPEDEFAYEGWFGVKSMPVLAERNAPWDPARYDPTDIQPLTGNFVSERLREHIFAVTRRWLDPDGDGDPGDGVDGFRLDVAAEVGMDFWRAYRRVVRETNPEAYLIGEVWWQNWPDELLDPAPYLQGDMFDAVMNYRWYRLARQTLARRGDTAAVARFGESLAALDDGIPEAFRHAMMNTMATHDSPRLATSLANPNRYKVNAHAAADSSFNFRRPDADSYARAELMAVAQFTSVGAPHVYYGDELGMWGGDDPDCRKPMWWADRTYAPEVRGPYGETYPPQPVGVGEQEPTQAGHADRRDFYRGLAALRRARPELRRGAFEQLDGGNPDVLAYRRTLGEARATVLLNASPRPQRLAPWAPARELLAGPHADSTLGPWSYLVLAD